MTTTPGRPRASPPVNSGNRYWAPTWPSSLAPAGPDAAGLAAEGASLTRRWRRRRPPRPPSAPSSGGVEVESWGAHSFSGHSCTRLSTPKEQSITQDLWTCRVRIPLNDPWRRRAPPSVYSRCMPVGRQRRCHQRESATRLDCFAKGGRLLACCYRQHLS